MVRIVRVRSAAGARGGGDDAQPAAARSARRLAATTIGSHRLLRLSLGMRASMPGARACAMRPPRAKMRVPDTFPRHPSNEGDDPMKETMKTLRVPDPRVSMHSRAFPPMGEERR